MSKSRKSIVSKVKKINWIQSQENQSYPNQENQLCPKSRKSIVSKVKKINLIQSQENQSYPKSRKSIVSKVKKINRIQSQENQSYPKSRKSILSKVKKINRIQSQENQSNPKSRKLTDSNKKKCACHNNFISVVLCLTKLCRGPLQRLLRQPLQSLWCCQTPLPHCLNPAKKKKK